MSYDYAADAAERYEAGVLDDLAYEDAQDALEADSDDLNKPCMSPYRCVDRMCGALDCSNCHPGCDGEEELSQEELDDVADLERNEEQ